MDFTQQLQACVTQANQALSRLPQVEGTGGDVQPSSELVRVLNLCDKLAQNGGTILFRQSCLFWRRLSLAAR